MNLLSDEAASPMPRVLLLGSLGVAVDCAEYLQSRDDVDLIGVVCAQSPRSAWRVAVDDRNMFDEAERLGLALVDLESVPELQPDLGISVRFHQILRKRHLDAFSLGVVNLHGAPLPEMRGSMCDAAALLQGQTEFGTSIHWMDEGIDEGDILAVERFPIAPEDTVFDLFQRANSRGLELVKTHLDDILSGAFVGRNQDDVASEQGVTVRTYFKDVVLEAREVPADATQETMWAAARAFSFPGHDPAHVKGPSGTMNMWVDSNSMAKPS